MKKIALLLAAALFLESAMPMNVVMANDVEPQIVSEEEHLVEDITEELEDAEAEEVVSEEPTAEAAPEEETVVTEEANTEGSQKNAKAAAVLADDTVITSEHIPDETLMKCVKDKLGKSETDTITYSDLQGIVYFEYNISTVTKKGWEPIESIQGMELMTKLQRLNLKGHNIKDISAIKDLAALVYVGLDNNKIESLPDLSANTKISTFAIYHNRIPAEDIQTKLPSKVSTEKNIETWAKKQLTTTLRGYETIHAYYDGNLKAHYPVMLKADIRTDRTYTYKSATVNGKDATAAFEMKTNQYGNGDYPYYQQVQGDVADFLKTESEVNKMELVLVDQLGEEYKYTYEFKTKDLEKNYVKEAKNIVYISSKDVCNEGAKIFSISFPTKTKDVKIDKVALVDANGTDVVSSTTATDTYKYRYYNGNDFRYQSGEDYQFASMVQNNCGITSDNEADKLCFVSAKELDLKPSAPLPDGYYSLVYTLSDGTTYTYKNMYKAVSHPVVFGVTDPAIPSKGSGFKVDQTGDYVSVHVYGLNLSKSTVTPVFVDEAGSAISGETEATEKNSVGMFYRMSKLNSSEWADWVEEKRNYCDGYQLHDVEVQFAEGVEGEDLRYSKTTQLYKNTAYFYSYNHMTNTYSIWLEEDVDVSVSQAPTLKVGTKVWNSEAGEYIVDQELYSKTGKITKGANTLSKLPETKATFAMSPEEFKVIDEQWSVVWELSYVNSAGETVIHRNGDVSPREHDELIDVRGNADTVFYFPYLIGGVYKIEAGKTTHYLTDQEIATLEGYTLTTNRYASGTGKLEEGNTPSREEYNLSVVKKAEMPDAPKGTSKLTLTLSDGKANFNWTTVEGAHHYQLWYQLDETFSDAIGMPAQDIFQEYLTGTSYSIREEALAEIFVMASEKLGIEDVPDKMSFFLVPVAQSSDGLTVAGEKSNIVTYKYSDGSCEHKNVVTDKAVAATCKSTGLTEGKHCKDCGEILEAQRSTPKTDHKYGAEKLTDATFEKDGARTRTCQYCGNKKSTPIAKVSKVSLSTEVYTYNGKTKKPTVSVKDSNGNTLSTSDYTVVYESGRKNVGQYTVTVALKNEYSGSKKLTFRIQPKTTTSVSAALSKYNAVKVSWKKVSYASGYRVFYKLASEATYKNSKVVKGTSITLSGLKAGAEYDIKVVARYKADDATVDSTAGKVASVITLKKLAAPTVEKSSSTKVRVRWKNIAGESGYQISRSTSKSKTSIISTYGTTSGSSKTFTATKNKNYYYKVRAYKTVNGKKVYGPWSDATAFSLRSVSKASGVKAVLSKNYNRVKFSWKKAAGANRYYLYVKEGSGRYKELGYVSGTYKYVQGLKAGVTYTFQVVPAYVSGGKVLIEGGAGTAKVTTLQKLNAPVVTRSSSKKVKVSWNNIAGESGYQISRSTKATGTSIQSTYGTTTGKSKTITAAKNKTYYYKVRAYKTVSGKKIYGPWSNVTKYTNK